MAETVHLTLNANGTKIDGDSTQTSLGRENTIECLSFIDSVRTAREKSSGMATGRATFEPMRFTKRIDQSSPLLAKALTDNEVVDGEFRFFRPAPAGDGTTEQFFTVKFEGGRLSAITRTSPDTIDPGSALAPPLEEVAIVFRKIIWTYEPKGVEHECDWKANK